MGSNQGYKTGLYIAIGLVAMVIVVVIILLATRDGNDAESEIASDNTIQATDTNQSSTNDNNKQKEGTGTNNPPAPPQSVPQIEVEDSESEVIKLEDEVEDAVNNLDTDTTATATTTPQTTEPLSELREIWPINNPNNIPGYNPDIFYTEENELSRAVKHDLVDKYADDHPWLLAAWNKTNHEGFKYILSDTISGAYVVNIDMTIPRSWYDNRDNRTDNYFLNLLTHELAHIYAGNAGGGGRSSSIRPGAVAAAHLYFSSLSTSYKCHSSELYADATMATVFGEYSYTGYWDICDLKVSAEALEIVEGAFKGEMPQWFYDTFQLADGNWDYEAIWSASKSSDMAGQGVFLSQWENEFGGYCSYYDARYSLINNDSLKQPWRDGGCD